MRSLENCELVTRSLSVAGRVPRSAATSSAKLVDTSGYPSMSRGSAQRSLRSPCYPPLPPVESPSREAALAAVAAVHVRLRDVRFAGDPFEVGRFPVERVAAVF